MGVKTILLVFFLCLDGGFGISEPLGKEFALVFMQNFLPNHGKPHLEVILTAFSLDTQATVWFPNMSFKKVLSLRPGSPVTVVLPRESELLHSARYKMTICISSNKEVSVVASNERPYTSSLGVVYPIMEWGKEYYMVTPDTGPTDTFGQIAIVNGPKPNLVEVLLKGLVLLENASYVPGEKLNLTLGPWEAVQLQSTQSLSGSHLVSQEPVGVFTGHSCAWKHTQCNHVCLQLLPVTSWGSQFVVPPVLFEKTPNTVYIIAAAETVIEVTHGSSLLNRTLAPGELEAFPVDSSTPMYISSTVGIMVLLYGSGGFLRSLSYDVFLINILPAEDFCTAYSLISKRSFINYALLVAQRKSVAGLQFNHGNLPNLKWEDVPGTDMLWAQMPFAQESGYNILSHPEFPFELFTVGIAKMNAYGVQGICLDKVRSLCMVAGCREQELCHVVGSASTCLPWLHQTCMAWGKSHYRTFHGSHLHLGNCTRVLIASLGDGRSSQPFSVERKPIPDFAARIRAFGLTVTIPGIVPGGVMVDGMEQYLPVTLKGGRLNITQYGVATVANFSFGLHVLIGAHGFIHLRIPSSYSGILTGMCGDYSSKQLVNATGRGEEVITPDQTWLTDGDEEDCASGNYEECPENTTSTSVPTPCHLMELGGVFQACHVMLDPKPFVDSCVFDVCEGGVSQGCSSLEAYAQACIEEGGNLTEWRNLTVCDLHCPPHSHYESCSSSCPRTCSGSPDSFLCDIKPCYEACVCDDGFQLSMGRCIPADQCGCMWDGHYYPHGKEFLSSDCRTQCYCRAPNEVQCHQIQGCDLGQSCELVGGQWSCNPQPYISCSVYGDPHYIVFDNQRYSFKGPCKSKIAGLCSPLPGLEDFDVRVVNRQGAEWDSAYAKAVDITVYGTTVTLSQEHKGVVVNGLLVHTPFVLDGNRLQLFQSGASGVSAVILQSDFGLIVSYDSDSRLLVRVPVSYAGAVCGLCASLPNGTALEVHSCSNRCQANCSKCGTEEYTLYGSQERCGMLKDLQGPFRDCHGRIYPDGYFQDCLLDLCHSNGSETVMCQTLSSYTASCQEVGAVVHSWRTNTFCSPLCPFNSHYDICAPSCPSACNASLPIPCQLPCREGCSCDPGYTLSGESCVLPEDCGCLHNGRYLKLSETFYDDKCRELCTCLEEGEVVCRNNSCHPGDECIVTQGVCGCFHRKLATCWASSSLHYHSFDGATFDANGNCSYIMGKVCEPSNVTAFEVHLRGEPMGSDTILRLGDVVLNVYGHTLTVCGETRRFQVDGVTKHLPTVIGNGKIMASMHGASIRLATDFGLLVTFNPSRFSLEIPMSYAGKVCGLCGNANQNASDDYGGLNATELLSEWVSHPGIECRPNPAIFRPDCHRELRAAFEGIQHCGLLLKKNGPFGACQSLVSPHIFFENCLTDVCVENGSREACCRSLAGYSAACQEAGAIVHPWRSETFCSFKCPINSQYSVCSDPCGAVCAAPEMLGTCVIGCREGCDCDESFHAEEDLCVPMEQCGCYENGTYYKLGSVVVEDRCQLRCFCAPGKQLNCEPFSCPSNQICAVQKGVLGCYPAELGESSVEATECRIDPIKPGRVSPKYTSCAVFGSLGYLPFGEGVTLKRLSGPCTVILAQLCQPDGDAKYNFEIGVEYATGGNESIESISARLYGMEMVLEMRETVNVWVNGILTHPPANLIPGKLWLKQDGTHFILETDFGLMFMYDTGDFLFIMLPDVHRDKVCGLCANSSKCDVAPERGQVAQVKQCFNQTENSTSCREAESANSSYCGLLLNEDGPFGACHNVVRPSVYFHACQARQGRTCGDAASLCQGLQDYVVSCQALGVQIKPWRNDSFCRFPCPLGREYEVCVATCGRDSEDVRCPSHCMEGCSCQEGLLWDGLSCVIPEVCFGEVTKAQLEVVIPQPPSPNVLSCDNNFPSQNISHPNCNLCTVSSHITTFSNVFSRLTGDSVLEILRLCYPWAEPRLRMLLRLRPRTPDRLHVFYDKSFITISSSLEVWVNGEGVFLPFIVTPDLFITVSEWDVTLHLPGKMTATFGLSGVLRVLVPVGFSAQLCGACPHHCVDSDGTIIDSLDCWVAQDLS